ncbi:DUF648 domain-containing protein [Chlamydia serpentis]|uniref:DUF648 domain-containing protein n=1 Tax=Chlamydia serpentis TaxID=1967782 RepID=UPI003B82E3BB
MAIPKPSQIIGQEEEVQISLIIKILKILSFLIFPLIAIALALHYFLHAKYNNCLLVSKVLQSTQQSVPIPGAPAGTFSPYKITTLVPMSQKNLRFIGSNPILVQSAFEATKPTFFCVPVKYRQIVIKNGKINFFLDLEKLADDINLDSVHWPAAYLNSPMDFCSDEDRRLIKKMQSDQTGTYISSIGKRSLLDFMLKYLFIDGITQDQFYNPSSGRVTLFPKVPHIYARYSKQNSTIWFEVFFKKGPLEEDQGGGFYILEQLRKLGVKFPIIPSQGGQNPDFERILGIRVYWETSYEKPLSHGVKMTS